MSHKYVTKVVWYILAQLSSLIDKINPYFVNYLRDATLGAFQSWKWL